MKIIVGLGNPGKEYETSRHNAGFMVVDHIAKELGISFAENKNCSALVAKTRDIVLIKPLTFMNESGKTVQSYLHYFRLLKEESQYQNLCIAYDDLDIPLGKWKWQFGTGPKAHNGVNSILRELGSDQFWHARVGTENRAAHRLSIPSDAYVLTPFLADEQATVEQVIAEVGVKVLSEWSVQ
jgi:PTH1 family peptidyl-tRNA hydrolase